MFTALDVREVFNPGTFERGREYLRAGHVFRVVLRDDGRGAHALVRNGRGTSYQCEFRWSGQAGRNWRIDSQCSCPVGGDCKHVAAALLKLADRAEAADSPSSDVAAKPMARAATPAARPPTPAEREAERQAELALDRWLDRLREPAVAAAEERLLFVLGSGAGDDGGATTTVQPVTCRRKRDGNWGKPKPFVRPYDDRFPRWMSLDEQELLFELTQRNNPYGGSTKALQGQSGSRLLARLLATGQLHWRDAARPALSPGEPRPGRLHWRLDAQGRQRLALALDDPAPTVLTLAPAWYVDEASGVLGAVQLDQPASLLERLLAAPPLPPSAAQRAAEELPIVLGAAAAQLPLPRHLHTQHRHRVRPQPVLRLLRAELAADPRRSLASDCAQLLFDYNGLRCALSDSGEEVVGVRGDQVQRFERDRPFEARAWRRLEELGLHSVDYRHFLLAPRRERDWLPLMLDVFPALEQQGWRIEADPDFSHRLCEADDDWRAQVEESAGSDWFGLSLDISIEGQRLPLLPLLTSFLRHSPEPWTPQKFAALDDSAQILLHDEAGRRWLKLSVARLKPIVGALLELFDLPMLGAQGELRLPRIGAGLLHGLEQTPNLQFSGADTLRELARRLHDFHGIRAVAPPSGLVGTLRPYQAEGLNWLQFLREQGFGGVLADDMGLGKTVQALAHLLVEKDAGRMDRPSLVIAPTSLMFNWRNEAARFAPALRVLLLHGAERHRHFHSLAQHDLVLTTYPLLTRDFEVLAQQPFHLLILDEAQNVKNARSKAAQLVGQLRARHRLCLTGTPMENHLGEFWSLMNFLMPGLFGDEAHFKRRFRTPIEKHGDELVRGQLVNRARPFLLRRTKGEVAKELPARTDIQRSVALEGAQRDLYETVRLAMDEKVRAEIAARGLARSHIVVLDALLKLRQVCCDPRLLKLAAAARVKESAKLDLLMELLLPLLEEGRRVLLFSQFTSMLELIEARLATAGIDYLKLTGATRDRERLVQRFQALEVPLFLISLKAGGVGLNLTAADTVIHYDPWWNPAVEQQATDRAHRIGQDKPVFVYKLLTEGTVEQKIVELQARKRALADALLSGSGSTSGWTAADLRALFAPLA